MRISFSGPSTQRGNRLLTNLCCYCVAAPIFFLAPTPASGGGLTSPCLQDGLSRASTSCSTFTAARSTFTPARSPYRRGVEQLDPGESSASPLGECLRGISSELRKLCEADVFFFQKLKDAHERLCRHRFPHATSRYNNSATTLLQLQEEDSHYYFDGESFKELFGVSNFHSAPDRLQHHPHVLTKGLPPSRRSLRLASRWTATTSAASSEQRSRAGTVDNGPTPFAARAGGWGAVRPDDVEHRFGSSGSLGDGSNSASCSSMPRGGSRSSRRTTTGLLLNTLDDADCCLPNGGGGEQRDGAAVQQQQGQQQRHQLQPGQVEPRGAAAEEEPVFVLAGDPQEMALQWPGSGEEEQRERAARWEERGWGGAVRGAAATGRAAKSSGSTGASYAVMGTRSGGAEPEPGLREPCWANKDEGRAALNAGSDCVGVDDYVVPEAFRGKSLFQRQNEGVPFLQRALSRLGLNSVDASRTAAASRDCGGLGTQGTGAVAATGRSESRPSKSSLGRTVGDGDTEARRSDRGNGRPDDVEDDARMLRTPPRAIMIQGKEALEPQQQPSTCSCQSLESRGYLQQRGQFLAHLYNSFVASDEDKEQREAVERDREVELLQECGARRQEFLNWYDATQGEAARQVERRVAVQWRQARTAAKSKWSSRKPNSVH